MARKIAGLLTVLCGVFTAVGSARGNVIVTLEAFGSNGQPVTGAVAPGTNVAVDILLSASADEGPVADVRLIQFDFDATGSGIQLVSFTWTVDANGYSFQDPDLPITNVTSISFGSTPGLLTLTTEPVKVATVDVTINGSGTLDAVNSSNTDDNYGADVRAGFSNGKRFTAMAGNLQGGKLDFSVTSGSGGGGGGGGGIGGVPTPNDQDGDGVADVDDAFPNDPHESSDTDGNGVGNNADPDDDSDGVIDAEDAFPANSNETIDSDGDGIGDNEDSDRDGDNVANNGDAFPDDPTETMDSDGDGIGNNADPDDDNDGILDENDAFPLDPNRGGVDAGSPTTGSQPRACGAGMLGSSMLMLLGLGLMSYRPRRVY